MATEPPFENAQIWSRATADLASALYLSSVITADLPNVNAKSSLSVYSQNVKKYVVVIVLINAVFLPFLG